MSVGAIIRRAQPFDLAGLADVERSAGRKFRVHFGENSSGGHHTLPLETLERSCGASLLWLAVAETRTVGFLAATPLQNSLHIEEFSVAYEHQGNGLGRRLMAAILAEAGVRQMPVTLTTEKPVPWSYPYYVRLGFREIVLDECPPDLANILIHDKQHSGDPEDRIAMRLDLDKE